MIYPSMNEINFPYYAHHFCRNFGGWIVQEFQVSIYMIFFFFFLEKKKNRRASKHAQDACVEASIIYNKIPFFGLDFYVVQKYP